MNSVKIKLSTKIFFIAIVAMLALCCFSFSPLDVAKAEGIKGASLLENCQELTEDRYFIVNNETKNISQYESYLDNRFQLDNKKFSTTNLEDEWILKIVPIEVFKAKKEFFYVGNAYGFYVNYDNNTQTYLVYLLLNQYEYYNGSLSREIRPLYYEQYVFDEQAETLSLVYLKSGKQGYYKKYSDCEKLYLKDVSFSGSLYNENHLNVDESGYIPNQDNGGYFSQSQYVFKGMSTQNGKTNFADATLEIGLGYIPLGASALSVGDVLNASSTITELNNNINNATRDFSGKVSNEKVYEFSKFSGMQRDKQIEMFGKPLKNSATKFQTNNTNDAVLLGINSDNYARNEYLINYYDQSNMWNTRYVGTVSLDIVKEVSSIDGSKVTEIANDIETVTTSTYTIDNGYSTKIELYEDYNRLYILNDAEHKVRFVAPENGLYTFNTYGNVKNLIDHNYAIEIDENNQKIIVDLNKGEEFFVNIKKYDFEGSAQIGIMVSFTPEEIEKGQTKTLTIAPGEREYLIYDSNTISFNYSCLNANEEIKLEFSKTVYYNDVYNHTGQFISGSIVHGTGKYYVSISNNGINTQFIDLKFSDTEEVSIENNNNLTVEYQNAYSINIPYTIDVTLTAVYNNNMLIEVYNSLDGIVARTSDSLINSLNFKILANQQYYVLIKHLNNTSSSIDVSFKKNIYKLSIINNNFMKLYKDETLLYCNNNYSGDYTVSSNVEFKIYDMEHNLINYNEDGSYTLIKNENYYFYIEETKNECHINFNLKYTTELNGTFPESGTVFIKYIPNQTGKYNISGIDNYFWHNENLDVRYGELVANQIYYLMIEGIMNTDYNISITYQEIVRTQIPLQVGVQRGTGKYYFIVQQSGNYIFKTYRESDVVSSTISLYDEDGNEYFSNICTDITSRTQYLSAGTYYLDLETTPTTETVSLRITKSR